MQSQLSKLLVSTCVLVGSLEKRRPAQRTGAGDGITLRRMLSEIKSLLLELLAKNGVDGYYLKTGSGNGYVAKVPWIFISKEAGPVASKIGITICFGRTGNGLVIGKMYPIGCDRGQKLRSANRANEGFIDVDGDSINTRYNNRFVSPTEVTLISEDLDKVEEIIISKIKMLSV